MADETSSSVFEPAPDSQAPRLDGSDVMAAALVQKGVWTQEQATAALAEPDAELPQGGTLDAQVSANREATELQGFLKSAQVDDTTSRFIGQMFEKAAQNPPSEQAKQQALADCEQHLRGLWGDSFAPMLAAAQSELAEMARAFPKLPEMLERTGLGNSSFLINRLASRAIEKAKARRLGAG